MEYCAVCETELTDDDMYLRFYNREECWVCGYCEMDSDVLPHDLQYLYDKEGHPIYGRPEEYKAMWEE